MALDSYQKKAAAHRRGKAAVSAAAGSGKTTLIVARALDLVREGERPEKVVTLAFNKNAQMTLVERLAQGMGGTPEAERNAQQMAFTFHGFAFRVLKAINPDLRVLPQSANDKRKAADKARSPAERNMIEALPTKRDLANRILNDRRDRNGAVVEPGLRTRYRDANVDFDALPDKESELREALFAYGWPGASLRQSENVEQLAHIYTTLGVDPEEAKPLAEFAQKFDALKRANVPAVVDFSDMLLYVGAMIRAKQERVMSRLAEISHLQIDEAQDGNELRWLVASTVAGLQTNKSVIAVGDLRQSIAGFAGAKPELFKQWWDKADAQFDLPNNYRSASLIVEAGNVVARGKTWNIGADSIAARADLGRGAVSVGYMNLEDIAQVVKGVVTLDGAVPSKDVAVLSRTRASLQPIAFALRSAGVKTVIRGGGSLWLGGDGMNIRAYLDLAEGRVRDDKWAGSIRRILNKPVRYLNRQQMAVYVTDSAINVNRIEQDADGSRAADRLLNDLYRLKDAPHHARVEMIEEWLLADLDNKAAENPDIEGRDSERGEMIKSLCDAAANAGSVTQLDILVAAELATTENDPQAVTLSTIHQAKGDQWGTVVVANVNEGVFPSRKATTPEEMEEELRLLYVAVTRPVHTLYVATDAVERFEAEITGIAHLSKQGDVPASEIAPPAPAVVPTTAKAAPLPPPPPEPTPGLPTGAELLAAIDGDVTRAEVLTSTGVQPAPGQRFVPVRWGEFSELLGRHGFTEDPGTSARTGQRVLGVTVAEGWRVLVYSTIPEKEDLARGLGNDSIKVVLVNAKTGAPRMSRQPYAARTRNWRVTLLDRIRTAIEHGIARAA